MLDSPEVVSKDEWVNARRLMVSKERDLADAKRLLEDARRALPMVEITRKYRFESEQGEVSLGDLFDGRRQLIVYHFMFDPEWEAGCPFCSVLADNVGHLAHLHARDTSLVFVSRAPLAKIDSFKRRMGWTFPWVSSFGSEFNTDFYATLGGTADPMDYMFEDAATLEARGDYYFTNGEQGGTSVFLREGDRVFHTDTNFGIGNDPLYGTFNYLSLTPLGQQDVEIRHHDRYELAVSENSCCGSQ